jgi:hypothetical protein
MKEMFGDSMPVIDSIHCINKSILCPANNDIIHISEVPTSLDGHCPNIYHIYAIWIAVIKEDIAQ